MTVQMNDIPVADEDDSHQEGNRPHEGEEQE
jgi:hypothetical protein